MFSMRFDMRAPDGGAPAADLYGAALDMVEWAEGKGCLMVVLSEHHASPDGFLPAPIVLASAMAARTKTTGFMIAAALLPFYDPVRLAEDIAVLDNISRGRVSYVFGLGYRPEEFAMFGIAPGERSRVVEEKLDVLLTALRGEPFARDGREIWVTPRPASPAGPGVFYGGQSVAAARRAARFGLGFFAQTDLPSLRDAYVAECAEAGRAPGMVMLPSPDSPTTVFVADDIDKAWDELGPYLLHDAVTYAAWNDDGRTASLSRGKTVDELRAERGAHRVVSVEEAVEMVRTAGMLSLHPLCGGLPPEIAWPYLERVVEEVIPAAVR